MASTILVTGATGNIGSQVVKQLSARGIAVRALVRNPEKAVDIAGPGVEIVAGDFDKPETLDAALKGIEKVFLVSAGDLHLVEQQGNVIQAAQRAHVRHIVKVGAIRLNGPIAFVRWHAQTEQQILDADIAYTFLHPQVLMLNVLASASTIAAEGVLYAPMKDGKIGLVDVRDIAAVGVAALTENGHEGKTYEITGPELLSYADIATKLSKVLGKQVTYVDIPPEAARQGMLHMGMPQWLTDDVIALFGVLSEGHAAVVTNVVADIAKKQPISFDQFAHDYAQAFKA